MFKEIKFPIFGLKRKPYAVEYTTEKILLLEMKAAIKKQLMIEARKVTILLDYLKWR